MKAQKYLEFPRAEEIALHQPLTPMSSKQPLLPLNASAARSTTDPELGKIGCVIQSVLGRTEVVSLKPGGPASGLLEPGDILISVNGVPVESDTQAKQLIIGLRGTSIQLRVMRDGEFLVFNIERN
jgi:C-terminal processing protease CtpA/Prc